MTAQPTFDEIDALKKLPPKSPAVTKKDPKAVEEEPLAFDPKVPFIKRADTSEDYDIKVNLNTQLNGEMITY